MQIASSSLAQMFQGRGICFPIQAIKNFFGDFYGLWPVHTVDVYAEPIGVGPWHVKWLYPAHTAKQVFRLPRIETVLRQIMSTAD